MLLHVKSLTQLHFLLHRYGKRSAPADAGVAPISFENPMYDSAQTQSHPQPAYAAAGTGNYMDVGGAGMNGGAGGYMDVGGAGSTGGSAGYMDVQPDANAGAEGAADSDEEV